MTRRFWGVLIWKIDTDMIDVYTEHLVFASYSFVDFESVPSAPILLSFQAPILDYKALSSQHYCPGQLFIWHQFL